MNEKLAKWTLKNIRPAMGKTGGNGGYYCEKLVTFHTAIRKGKTKLDCVRFSFHAKAIKQLGWLPKDKITFDFEDGVLTCYRSENGYTLGCEGISKSSRSTRYYLRAAMPEEYCKLFYNKEASEVEISDGRISFLIK